MPALCKKMAAQPFWGRGFRPFFFLGSIYTVLSILLWAGVYAGHVMPPDVLGTPVYWHAHEMIYGFGMAIVAGFLLTAVANWTGGAPVRQYQLMTLAGLWVLGRVVMNIGGLPLWAVLIGELLFLPALAISLSLPLLKSWNTRNFIFLGLLTFLFICDAAFLMTQAPVALYCGLLLILVMISLIGGRIIPAFTVGALRRKGVDVRIHDQPMADKIALLSLAMVALVLLFGGVESYVFACAAFIAAAVHLYRMRRYHTLRVAGDPLVWILHAGYFWLVLGLVFAGLSVFGIGTFSAALHALTVGSIGSMTLGMICRVTLGHTGRDLSSNTPTILAFALMQVAAVLRVFGPVVFPDYYTDWVMASGLLWAVCFSIYLFFYAPMLFAPRPDHQPA